jgi:asparagine synthase (glutamine-hydrolysing)
MCAVLRHRGPDDEGVWTDGMAGLGHRRLAIIDLSPAGHQPMCNEGGMIWVTFNGEIYDFQELRALLEKRGHQFHSQTDVETLVHLYEDEGVHALFRLNGMFAFALWDMERQRLLLARDRLGQKPLYYGVFDRRLYFASEIKALIALPNLPRQVNWRAIDHYLTYRYVPGALTAFKGIYKLPPAHYLLWERGDVSMERYWEPSFTHGQRTDERVAERELLALLEGAVQRRLVSDAPIGAFLSGGMDSSSVVALMSQASSRVRTFSIGFREVGMSELPYARQVAERFDTEHHEFIVQPKALQVLPHLIWHYDEPFADASAIPTYYVSQMTSQAVTVALSGDGGDECFGGYERYHPRYHYSPLDWVPSAVRRPIFARVSRCFPNRLNQRDLTWRLRYHLQAAANSPLGWYMRTVRLFSSDLKSLLYSKAMRSHIGQPGGEEWYQDIYEEAGSLSPIERAIRADLFTYLPDAMLVKVDVASMAHSLEVRSPFLDHKVVEFAARLPLSLKIRGNTGKYLLKRAMAGYLPHEILYRRKKGFSVPLSTWICGDMREFIQEVLYSGKELPYFKPESIEDLFAVHLEGRGNYAPHIWAIVNLYLWHQMFISKSISPPGNGFG